ncbi:MAG TPA: lactate permease LctP family transporter [Saprospiraceae bacterium]|nr:lactate permease LctP family transporter [Saprospiraceae bacterium]HNT20541.1 lactate permease LctP family transporter [Saprospiraceae bacterium]
MTWTQNTDPLNNIAWSALVAALPVILIFWLLIKKMKGYQASLLTVLFSIVIAVVVYGMPLKLSLLSGLHGALYGLFPICWIILSAVFLFNLTIKAGQFEIIKNFMASVTPDRRLQALLIAFSFGAFLEGAAGFGAPVAISAAMLVGLGFNPLYAAGICLIANTAPVAFGSVGTPIIMAGRVSEIPEMAISQMVGRTLPILSVVLPFYLVVLMSGFKKSLQVFPAIVVSGLSFAFFQWFAANYLGPMLPDVMAGIASIFCLMILLKYWKPSTVWRFNEEPEQTLDSSLKYSAGQVLRAWSPFIIMTIVIVAWGLQPVKDSLNHLGMLRFDIPGLNGAILKNDGSPLVIRAFEFNYLSAPGTAVLFATLISIPLIGLTYRQGLEIFRITLKQLRFPILTVAAVVGFAFIANNSAMSITMALALAGTGALFPFFSPILGWLGVFLTGSDTSSNALFCKLQSTTADTLGIDPVITVSANASGGVTGKMISPQSIAIGAAAVGLIGKESDLFRFTLKHSFIMLLVICLLTTLQAYTWEGLIPSYTKPDGQTMAAVADGTHGFTYLMIMALAVLLLVMTVYLTNRKSKERGKP